MRRLQYWAVNNIKQLVDTLLLLDTAMHVVGVKPEHTPFLKERDHYGVTYSSSIELKSESLCL